MDERRMLRCACGWEARGSIDELVVAAGEHGARIHNMEPTRDQVIAMIVDEVPDAAGHPPAGEAAPGA
jgi:predicted small metal-binding protein